MHPASAELRERSGTRGFVSLVGGYLLAGFALFLPCFFLAAALEEDRSERAKWSTTGAPEDYPGGTDLFVVAGLLAVLVVFAAGIGAVLWRGRYLGFPWAVLVASAVGYTILAALAYYLLYSLTWP